MTLAKKRQGDLPRKAPRCAMRAAGGGINGLGARIGKSVAFLKMSGLLGDQDDLPDELADGNSVIAPKTSSFSLLCCCSGNNASSTASFDERCDYGLDKLWMALDSENLYEWKGRIGFDRGVKANHALIRRHRSRCEEMEVRRDSWDVISVHLLKSLFTRQRGLERCSNQEARTTPSAPSNTRLPRSVRVRGVGPSSHSLLGTHDPPSARAIIWCPKQMPVVLVVRNWGCSG